MNSPVIFIPLTQLMLLVEYPQNNGTYHNLLAPLQLHLYDEKHLQAHFLNL